MLKIMNDHRLDTDPTTHRTESGIVYTQTGEGRPIVLIHGVVHSKAGWDDVVPLLDGHTTYAIDLPGHGESDNVSSADAPDGDIAELIIGRLAEFVDAVAASHGEKPLLVGNSLGGYLAIELALRGHGRGAVGFSPAGFFHGRLDQLRTIYQFLALRGIARLIKPLLPAMSKFKIGRTIAMGMFSAKPWKISPEVVMRDAKGILENTIIDEALSVEFPFSPDAHQAETSIPTPIICIWGTFDLTLIRGWTMHNKILPQARLKKLPGLGHVTMFDDPETVAEEILAAV